jgi:hypothetical protein
MTAKYSILLILLAALSLAAPTTQHLVQIGAAGSSGGDCSTVQMTLLDARWSSLPQYNGSLGALALTFYSSCTYNAVTFTAVPQCPYLSPGQPAFVQHISAGSTFSVTLPVYAESLNATCPVEVVASAEYGADFSTVLGATGAYFLTVFVPPYPYFSVSLEGAAYLGAPSRLTLEVRNPYSFPAEVSVSSQSAAVLSPTSPVAIRGDASIPLVVAPFSSQSPIVVTIASQDYLGNPVSYTYTLYVSAAQPPPPKVSVSPGVLYLDTANEVNITVEVPFGANGSAAVSISGASVSTSPVVVPIVDGRGTAVVSITPLQSPVVFQVSASYSVGGYQQSAQASTAVEAIQPLAALASLAVSPQMLIANSANNLTVAISAPGSFNASITISGASTSVPMPAYISGRGSAVYSLVVYPYSQQVSLSATIKTDRGVQQYTVSLPVTTSNILLAVPSPSSVAAGGNRTVTVELINQGSTLIEKGVVVITPAAGSSALMGTVAYNFSSLAPLGVIELPISFIVPAGQAGPIPFQYTVYYVTPLGSGQEQGTFYVQALQPPSLSVTSVSVTPQRPQAGSPFFVSITAVNNGFVQVNNLEVALKAPRGLVPITPATSYIGALAPQQTQTATFSLNATAPGNYTVYLVVTYQDQYGVLYNQTIRLPVPVGEAARGLFPSSRQTASSPSLGATTAAVIAVAVVAAVLIAIGAWRRRR